jgi:hypothetical protein
MKNNKKETKVLNKTIDVKFKTKSGDTIAFKAIKTSLKPSKDKKSNRTHHDAMYVKSNRRKDN